MLRKNLINYYKENGFDSYEASTEVDFVIEMVAGLSSKDILLGESVPEDLVQNIEDIIKERVLTGKPIQQIVGQAFFIGDKFLVNEYTLIPRPETEILVLECLKKLSENEDADILDIGTGSGCIPVEIAKNNNRSKVVSVDICEKALETAKKNAVLHKVQDKIDFIKSDVFSNVKGEFDIIISNPPYIPLSEKDNLQKEVRDFEPHNALFANDIDGVEFYKKIIEGSKDYLKKGGFILFELGIGQAEKVKNILAVNGYYDIEIIKDIDLIERVIIGKK